MVGLGRLELPTSPLSGVRSNQLSYKPIFLASRRCDLTALIRGQDCNHPSYKPRVKQADGGAKQDRTADLLRARQALSQLSYSPISLCRSLFFKQDYLCRHCIKCVFRRNGKEVIQPQVPLGLPCYDFTPVMKHKVVIVLPKVRLTTSFASHSHGVTGGVYKARERIHRSILTCDY